MARHLFRQQWVAVLTTVLFVASLAVPAFSVPAASPGSGEVSRLALGAEGKGERGPVSFSHDGHTLAVKDCVACHQPFTVESDTPFAFAPKPAPAKLSRQNFMHDGCTTCHEAQQRGPLQAQCADCHKASPSAELFKPGLDRSLHARHIASPFVVDTDMAADLDNPVRGQNCAVCHHPLPQNADEAPDGTSEATPSDAAPLRESCRTCHAAGDAPSLRTVGHETCVLCHQTTLQSGKVSGPVQCAGCHDAEVFAGYQRLNPVPPLQAGQPVSIILKSVEKPSMPGVPFNHRLHENSLPSCASCHHNTVQACSTCHTPDGDPKGGKVTLSAAMHNAQASNSCVGCHEQRQLEQADCAGCHAMRPTGSVAKNCAFCHRPAASLTTLEPAPSVAAPPVVPGPRTSVAVLVSPEGTPAAQPSATVPAASLPLPPFPETVTIGGLSKEFQPSSLPHGKIVRALQRGISSAEPSLALRHDNAALCAACHHNTPVSAKPPACASCHENTVGPARSNTPPPLRLAYHQQCMGCHERMDIPPVNTDCAGCHAPVERRTGK